MRAALAMRFWQKVDANPGMLAVATLLSSSRSGVRSVDPPAPIPGA